MPVLKFGKDFPDKLCTYLGSIFKSSIFCEYIKQILTNFVQNLTLQLLNQNSQNFQIIHRIDWTSIQHLGEMYSVATCKKKYSHSFWNILGIPIVNSCNLGMMPSVDFQYNTHIGSKSCEIFAHLNILRLSPSLCLFGFMENRRPW